MKNASNVVGMRRIDLYPRFKSSSSWKHEIECISDEDVKRDWKERKRHENENIDQYRVKHCEQINPPHTQTDRKENS